LSSPALVYQVNLQRGFGGGEVFTAIFTRALKRVGVDTVLFVDGRATAWASLPMPDVRFQSISDPAELPSLLRILPPAWIVFHTLPPRAVVDRLREDGHFATAFAHMPLYGRDPRPLAPFDLIIAGSRHVMASLRASRIDRVYGEPLYAFAQLERAGPHPSVLRAKSRYDWDRHKVRDRLLGAVEPMWRLFRSEREFRRRPGLTLGIVSRITPIKQFPLLFAHIVPVLTRYPEVNLEIFGSGGYASIRDLDRVLSPLRERVRFWGHQSDVRAAYQSLDFLLTGLPEKEALGLNVIEAQACGTPVLAPDAPPFDETVVHGATGLRYRDPREDGAAAFESTLKLILKGAYRFDADAASAHLKQFSEDAFVERVRLLVRALGGTLPRASALQS
jgi:glycosyltransferase involved in cell wall biosynthesis